MNIFPAVKSLVILNSIFLFFKCKCANVISFNLSSTKTDITIIIFSSFLFVFSNRCTVLYQKRFKKERKIRIRIQQKLDTETKRRNQIEDALKASGAPAEALRILSGKFVFSFFNSFST